MPESRGEVTQLLARWAKGDRSALDGLMPVVYAELRQIAEGYLRRERSGHTLQPTALVNEAWLRLVRQDQPSFENRKRFFALAAQVMRHILVDYARTHKRTIPHDAPSATPADFEQFLALDQALAQLAQASPREARIIEMRYFGGLNGEEIAELLEISAATVSRDQAAAEAWLARVVSV